MANSLLVSYAPINKEIDMRLTKQWILGTVAAAALSLSAVPAAADAVYHTERLELTPVAGAPLKEGFVVNIHANGPRIYARERYVVAGATPSASYEVWLTAYPSSPNCAGDPGIVLKMAEITTNKAGNGTAQAVFVPEDVVGLVPPEGITVGGQWLVKQADTVVYQTACTAITLDYPQTR
jgi:hypothetical protein